VPEWVFPDSNGNIRRPDDFRENVFYKALEIAELRRIRVNDLRHIVASLLLNRGNSMLYVKEQLGHSSIKVTLDLYGHYLPSENRGLLTA